MATVYVYNEGIFRVVSSAVSGSTDLRCLVIAGASLPAGAKNKDLDTVADVLAVTDVVEAAVSGYARRDIAGFAVNKDDTGDDVDLTWTQPSWTPAAGETWRARVYYIEGASDAARQLVMLVEPDTPYITNGGQVDATTDAIRLAQA